MYGTMTVTTATVSALPSGTLPPLCPSPSETMPTEQSAPHSVLVSAAMTVADSNFTTPAPPLDIAYHFGNIPDPRHPAFRDYHLLSDILVIALSAMLSGCKSWEAIAEFGTAKEAWFRSIGLRLPNGIPSHDTFYRLFSTMAPRPFQDSFTSWINAICRPLGFCHIPIDGKSLRGTRGPEGTCLHLVSAWVAGQRLSMAQVAVEGKGNEITAIPKLLEMLNLHKALVSIDAIGCQKDIARQIRAAGGDYLLALKDNQPTLHKDVQSCFDTAYSKDFKGVKHDVYATQEVNHGRYEERICTVIYQPQGLSTIAEWQDLKAVVRVVRIRREHGKESIETAHFISSSTGKAQFHAEAARNHWGIENGQHWVLDVVFAEDRCRSNHGHAAENLAWLRKMALSVFAQDHSKGSVPTRQIRAAADDPYRLHLLNLLSEKYA